MKKRKLNRKKEMGEAPHGIKLYDIPVKYTGIKPGVRLPFLFRLDATKERAIWHSVRQLNTVCMHPTPTVCIGKAGLKLEEYNVAPKLPFSLSVNIHSEEEIRI